MKLIINSVLKFYDGSITVNNYLFYLLILIHLNFKLDYI